MKIEYKAIDDKENIYRGVETVSSIEELCRRLAKRNLMPIAIRGLGHHTIETFTQLSHLKGLKKKLEYKVDQDVNIDIVPVKEPPLKTKRRWKLDSTYVFYAAVTITIAVLYYIGF